MLRKVAALLGSTALALFPSSAMAQTAADGNQATAGALSIGLCALGGQSGFCRYDPTSKVYRSLPISDLQLIPNERGIVMGANPMPGYPNGIVCDGTADAAPALAAYDAYAKAFNADLFLPNNATCLIKTGFAVTTNHTHWRSGSRTTLQFDPAATNVSSAGITATMVFNDLTDLFFDHITFNGTGANTLPCTGSCGSVPRIGMVRVNSLVFRYTYVDNFGQLAGGVAAPNKYAQGLSAFGGQDWDIGYSEFENNSGDGLALSYGATRILIHHSRFVGNGDSQIACITSGPFFKTDTNFVQAPAGNIGPDLVFDRCQGWGAAHDIISGGAQGVRAARYGDSVDTSHDFSIIDETISGVTDKCISVESSAVVQGTKGISPNGGNFAVMGNKLSGCPTAGIGVNDSEFGTIIGNTIAMPNPHFTGSIAPGSASGTGVLTVTTADPKFPIQVGMQVQQTSSNGVTNTNITSLGTGTGGTGTYNLDVSQTAASQALVAGFNYGILIDAYQASANTGSLTVADNAIVGTRIGILQTTAGGTLTPSACYGNMISGQMTAYTSYTPNMCTAGQ